MSHFCMQPSAAKGTEKARLWPQETNFRRVSVHWVRTHSTIEKKQFATEAVILPPNPQDIHIPHETSDFSNDLYTNHYESTSSLKLCLTVSLREDGHEITNSGGGFRQWMCFVVLKQVCYNNITRDSRDWTDPFENADSGVHHPHLYLPFKNRIQLRGRSPAMRFLQVMVVKSRPKAVP